jgi:hypothetical protein
LNLKARSKQFKDRLIRDPKVDLPSPESACVATRG